MIDSTTSQHPATAVANVRQRQRIIPLAERAAHTPAEFAGLFGRSETWGYRQLYSGRVKAIRVSGRLLIPRSEVDRLLAEAAVYTGVPAQAPQQRGNRSARNITPGSPADEVGVTVNKHVQAPASGSRSAARTRK